MLSLALNPVAIEAAPAAGSHPYGGTLTLGFDHRPTAINPIFTSSGISVSILGLVFNPLVRYNAQGEIEPCLAKSWEISADGRVYTFHLRKGVRFHDGVEFTSADALYTYRKIMDPAVDSPFRENLSDVETIRALDRYTLEITLKAPSASFLYQLRQPIAPEHLYEKENIHTGAFNERPVGTGPFRFVNWNKKTDEIVLAADNDYFEGRPYLNRVVYKTFANQDQTWSAFMRGEIDLLFFASVEDFELVRKDAAFKTFAIPGAGYYALFYNLNDPLLADIEVRRAIALSIDRRELIDKVEKGYGTESVGPFHPSLRAFDPSVKPIPYDPIEAEKILIEDGWARGKEGLLEKSGKPLILRINVEGGNKKALMIVEIIRQRLQEVGIRVEVDTDGETSGPVQSKLMMHIGMDMDAHQIIQSWRSADNRKKSLWKGRAFIPGLDGLIDAGETIDDKAEKEKIYHQIHRLIYREQPACFLYYPYYLHASSVRIGNADLYLNPYMLDYAIKDFYIKKEVMPDGDH